MNIEELVNLTNGARRLETYVKETLPTLRKGENDCDKQRDEFYFGTVNRPCENEIGTLSYISYHGFYGSSSVYGTLPYYNEKYFREAVCDYLNKHKDEIMLHIADYIKGIVKTERDEAIEKLNNNIKTLEGIE